MNTQPYNKSSLAGIHPFTDASQAPAGEACNHMDWHTYFTYDGSTGNLIWKTRTPDQFHGPKKNDCRRWNRRYAGSVAGHLRVCYEAPPRRYVVIEYTSFAAHRIIWEMHNRPIPKGMEIDHADGNQLNNKIENLRLATRHENARNCKPLSRSHCGIKGIRRRGGCWDSRICVDGRRVYLGMYPTKGLAAVARAKAAIRYHGPFARFT